MRRFAPPGGDQAEQAADIAVVHGPTAPVIDLRDEITTMKKPAERRRPRPRRPYGEFGAPAAKRAAPRQWKPQAGAAAAFAAVWVALVTFELLGVTARLTAATLAVVGAAWVGAFLCFRASRRSAGSTVVAWRYMTGAMFCWGAGEAVWGWYEIVVGRDEQFPAGDAIYVIGTACAVAGVLMFLTTAVTGLSRVRVLLESMVAGSSLLFTAWIVLYDQVIDSTTATRHEQVASISSPLSDVVIAAICVLIAARSRVGHRRSLGMLALAFTVMAAGDTSWAYVTLRGTYSTGHFVDLGWVAAFGLMAWAAWRPVEPETSAYGTGQLGVALPVLPFIPVLIAAATGFGAQLSSFEFDAFLFWCAGGGVLLGVFHQIATFVENLALTRRLEAEIGARRKDLHRTQAWWAAIVQNSSDVITVADQDLNVRYLSPSVRRQFGWDPDELIGRSVIEFVPPTERPAAEQVMRESMVRPGTPITFETVLSHGDGSFRHSEITVTSLVGDGAVDGLVLNARDISERKALEGALTHQAFHDSLTQLANRALFRDRLEHALARKRRDPLPLYVVFLDLDGFKTVNDSFGHAAGDALLIQVADRLRIGLRPGDTVARLGGDEFAVLLEDCWNPGDATAVAERILEAMATPFHVGTREVHVRASIGLASSADGRGADDLLRNADLAMYQAKSRGKARYEMFEASMHTSVVSRMQLESDLRGAVERNELRLDYQPIVMLDTGHIVAVEALVRWHHPERGVIQPSDFIPVAEETGLINAIGRHVLALACHEAARWGTVVPGGLGPSISVNVSARQLARDEFLAEVEDALIRAGLPATSLTLELTESVLIDSSPDTLGRLDRIKALGVKLAIDDFGTGYSSLSYLQRYPLDILKIDRSFVAGLGDGGERGKLVRSIVGLGRTLNLRTVAEGIETPEQLAELIMVGCEEGQGKYFMGAVDAAQLREVLAAGRMTAASSRPA